MPTGHEFTKRKTSSSTSCPPGTKLGRDKMYLIKVESKAFGGGWFRCFPDDEKKKSYITDNISFAKQYSRKNVAEIRMKRILEKTDAVSAMIVEMDLLEYRNQMEDKGIALPESTGIIKARITASPMDLIAAIDLFEKQFDIIDVSDIVRDTNSKFARVYITYRHKQVDDAKERSK